jgi:hypothetical protein
LARGTGREASLERVRKTVRVERARPDTVPREARAYILGGNAGTLAFVSSLRPQNRQVTAHLLTLAHTPYGIVIGEGRQRVNIAADNVGGWVDQTFPPEDQQAFIASLRDLDMLARIGWHAEPPERLSEEMLLNPEDVPEPLLDAIDQPARPLVQCAVCRRTCVRDDFVWNERQLCAWDYHSAVFGRRGPWRGVPYEERLFETLPSAAYVSAPLLDELGVEPILAVNDLPEDTMRRLVNTAIEEAGDASYLAVRTDGGLTLLRERHNAT